MRPMASLGWTRVAAVVAAVAAGWLAGCASLESMLAGAPKPTAALRNVAFKDVSLTKLGLQFDVDVTNPYDVPLPLVNLDYGLSAGSGRLLKGVADLQGTIPAKQTKTLSLPVDVSFMDVLNFAKGLRPGTAVPYNADVKLGVDAPGLGRIPIPLGKQGEIKIPAVPGL